MGSHEERMGGTEKLCAETNGGKRSRYRTWAKRYWHKQVRRLAQIFPEDAPRKLRSRGWA